MRSPAAQILDTALALQRAPGERFRLRERPLPAGILHLIEVAAASPQALQASAAELGEPEQALVEASRFYLEQVLLADPDADAYRTLGVAPEASFDAIRTHHRWLQRWLHPDRALAGDASVFATRVNQAFAQLRTPELRQAYDVRLAEARMAGAAAPLTPETLRRWEHGDEAAPSGVGRRSRWLLAAALVSCVVLAVLIVRNPQNAVEWHPDGEGAASVATNEVHDTPAIEDRDLGVLSDALSTATASPSPASQPMASVPAPAPQPRAAESAPASQPTPIATPPRIPTAEIQKPRAVVAEPMPSRRESTPVAAPSAPASRASAPPVVQVAAVAPAALVPEPAAAPPPPPAAPTLSPERMRLAEEGVEQVVDYFRAEPSAFPLWNDPAVQARTTQLRGALNARHGSFELRDLDWKVGTDDASLDATYRCRPAAPGACGGRLMVDLVWRQGYWFVRRVSLAPST
ncbi:MAG: J domain-containing protein [Luteimonas sp.]